MISDLTILAKAVELAEVAGDGAAVDYVCDLYPDSFDGVELAGLLLGLDGRTVKAIQNQCSPAPSPSRGVVVVNRAGRLGVSIGRKVLEPCGRQWALIPTDPGRYVWCGFAPTVRYTS